MTQHGVEDLVTAPWLRRLVVAALLIGLAVLGFQVLQPFVVPVVWAAILAYVTWPAYMRLLVALRGRRALSSLLMTLALTTAVILPTAWLITLLRAEAVNVYREFAAVLATGGPRLPEILL